MGKQLARVADPKALDEAEGTRAKVKVTVLTEWLEKSGELTLTPPRLLTCARCDGGGCDSCERSGALSAPRKKDKRVIHVKKGGSVKSGSTIRVTDPFNNGDVDQLLIKLIEGDEPTMDASFAAAPPPSKPISVAPPSFVVPSEPNWLRPLIAAAFLTSLTLLSYVFVTVVAAAPPGAKKPAAAAHGKHGHSDAGHGKAGHGKAPKGGAKH